MLSVTQLNSLIQREISFSPYLKKLEVEAELASFTRHRNGHLYFTIKDAFSSMDCVMFRSSAQRLRGDFQVGDQVLLRGQINLYEKTARLQFYAQSMEALGEGRFLKEFFALKEKLEREGLIREERRRALPRYPRRLALLSSATGAAKRDFLTIFHKRNPFCEILFFPVSVQGESTVPDILEALDQAMESNLDLVVITRGGGNYEDLRWFNDEKLVRKVAVCSVPLICAIGHEQDVTLIELVADRRGATPTQAAQLAGEDVTLELEALRRFFQGDAKRRSAMASTEQSQQRALIHGWHFRLEKNLSEVDRQLFTWYQELLRVLRRALIHSHQMFQQMRESLLQRFWEEKTRIGLYPGSYQESFRLSLESAFSLQERRAEFLRLMNPLETLQRGFARITVEDHPLQSIRQAREGERLEARLQDGVIRARIEEVEEDAL